MQASSMLAVTFDEVLKDERNEIADFGVFGRVLLIALALVNRQGFLLSRRFARSGSMRVASFGLALAVSIPSGRPRPSARTMIFVPLPRLVLPTFSPLFL